MYLLLEKALVGWVTILVELLVAVLLMVYKIWLDYGQRYALDRQKANHISGLLWKKKYFFVDLLCK